jgi:hypothetical protein
MERRGFLSTVGVLGTLVPLVAEAAQRPEVENYWATIPAGGALYALSVFCTDEPVEFTVGVGEHTEVFRGRFGGQRLHEFTWRNTTGNEQRVAVRAKAVAGDRELPPSKVQFINEQHVYVAFGIRGTPEKPADRHGSYPYDAVFVGFVTFE